MQKIAFFLFFCFAITLKINAQWVWQNPLPQGNNLNGVKVFNDGSIIAVGNLGTVIRTKDKGKTWDSLNVNTNRNLNSMFFIDNNTGWIVGDSGLILKTTDKGNTWVRQTWNDTIHVNLISVYFLNPDNGFIGTEDNVYGDYYGALLHTNDGGNSWDYEKFYGEATISIL